MRVAGSDPRQPQAVSRGGGGGGHRRRAPAADHAVQPLQRLGQAARGARRADRRRSGSGTSRIEGRNEHPRRDAGHDPRAPAGAASAARPAGVRRRRAARRHVAAGRVQRRSRANGRPLCRRRARRRRRPRSWRRCFRTPPSSARPRPRSPATGRSRRSSARASLPTSTSASCAPISASPRPARCGVTDREFGVSALGFLAQHLVVLLDPARLVANMHDAYREPGVDAPLRRVHDRPVGHRRHRGGADPRRAGHPQPDRRRRARLNPVRRRIHPSTGTAPQAVTT